MPTIAPPQPRTPSLPEELTPVPRATGPRQTRGLLLTLTLLFATLCSAPYVVGAARTPTGMRFTGLIAQPFDQEYYLASLRSAADRLEPNRFSPEAHAPGPIAQQYPLLGRLGALLGLGPMFLYHVARVLSSLLLPLLLFVLMRLCFPADDRKALGATALALFATGLGSLAPDAFSWVGADGFVVEATLFRSTAIFPHFSVAYLGVTASLIAIVLAVQGASMPRILRWGLAGGLLLSVSHAFLLLPLGLSLAVVGGAAALDVVRSRRGGTRLRKLVGVGAAIFAPAFPFLLILRSEMIRFGEAQGHPFPDTPSHQVWTWLGAYFLLLPFAVAGLTILAARRSSSEVDSEAHRPALGVLVVFLAVETALIFTPFLPFQRRFSEGLIIPLAALAAVGLGRLPRVRRPLLVLLIPLTVLSTVRLSAAATYFPDAVWRTFGALGKQDVVLTDGALAAAIPAFSPATVYTGRPVETLHYEEKQSILKSFREDPTSTVVWRALRGSGVNLLITDQEDPSIAIPDSSLPPACFEPTFKFGPLAAYRLRADCPTI